MTETEYFEEGLEDALDGFPAKPPALFYDSYMNGYETGKEIRGQKGWVERYEEGLVDGRENKDMANTKSAAYARGYSNGLIEYLGKIEAALMEEE